MFCTDRKAYAVALQQEGTGYICGKETLRWPEYREQGGAWSEMKWWHSQTMQSPRGHVKDYNLYPKSRGRFEVGYCGARNSDGGLGKVGHGQSGWVESVKRL